jgi:hypothetical protein
VSNLSFGSGVVVIGSYTGSPDPRQHPFGSGHRPVSGQLCRDHRRRVRRMLSRVSCCLSATGIRLSGHPIPAAELGLPHGRLTGHQPGAGPQRVTTFCTYEIRPGWVPPRPRGRRCSPGRMTCPTGACRFPAASPYTPLAHPIGGATQSRGINGGSRHSPVRSAPHL